MRLQTFLIVLATLLIAAFTAVNWSAFTTPTTLSLVVTSVQAPLGLVMLCLLGVVVLFFGGYMVAWQGRLLLEARRHTKELQAQRTLADQAEASRFTELRNVMKEELAQLARQLSAAQESLRTELQDNVNSLSAMVAELDDRLHHESPGRL